MNTDHSVYLLISPRPISRMAQARFHVEGLSCAADSTRLGRHLARQAGVVRAAVNPVNEVAYVTFEPTLTSVSFVRQCIEHQGFGSQVGRDLTP